MNATPVSKPTNEQLAAAALTLWRLATSQGAQHPSDWKFSANDLARAVDPV